MKNFIILMLTLTVIGCSSGQKVIVTKSAGWEKDIPPSRFTSFNEALNNSDFLQAESLARSLEQRMCAFAYRAYAIGNEDAAVRTALPLVSSKDTLAARYALRLMTHVLFLQGKWNDLGKLPSENSFDDPSEITTQQVLTEAFSSLPEEELIYTKSPHRVTITLSPTGTPVAEVEINGIKKNFWFDTGAGLTVISSDIAEECGVIPAGGKTAESGTATSKVIGFRPAEIEDFRIGGIRVRHHRVMILNREDLEFKFWGLFNIMKIEGIIGWNLISRLGWDVDYRNRTLLPFIPGTQAINGSQNFFWFGYPAIQTINAEGKKMLFGLDTGAKTSFISNEFLAEAEDTAGERESKKYGGAGGYETVEVKKLKNINILFAGNNLLFREIYAKQHRATTLVNLCGVLGSDIAKDGKLILNYPHRRIELIAD